MRYLIHIPGAEPFPQALKEAGLAGLLAEGNPQGVPLAGPAGMGGMFFWPKLDGRDCFDGFDLGKQTWRDCGKFWLGWETGRPVHPEAIGWRKQYLSLPVVLADGNAWQIPIAGRLPRNWGCDSAGKLQLSLKPEFAEFCQLAERVFVAITSAGQGEQDLELPEAWDYCCQALALNYRTCPQIIAALGLLDDTNFLDVLAATIELPLARQVEEDFKKKASASVLAG